MFYSNKWSLQMSWLASQLQSVFRQYSTALNIHSYTVMITVRLTLIEKLYCGKGLTNEVNVGYPQNHIWKMIANHELMSRKLTSLFENEWHTSIQLRFDPTRMARKWMKLGDILMLNYYIPDRGPSPSWSSWWRAGRESRQTPEYFPGSMTVTSSVQSQVANTDISRKILWHETSTVNGNFTLRMWVNCMEFQSQISHMRDCFNVSTGHTWDT